MNRDGRLLLAARVVRSCASGFFGVSLAIYLNLLGYSGVLIGIALTASLVGSASFTILASFLERRYGRKRILILFVFLSTTAGIIFILSTNYAELIFATCIGTISYTGRAGGGGPFLPVEQAIIPQTVSAERRTLAYATFNTGARLATSLGALLIGVPPLLETSGLNAVDSFRVIFSLSIAATFSTLFFFNALSKETEVVTSGSQENRGPMLSQESKRRIGKLATLMGLDSFGTGFIIQSIASLWFFTKFGASLSSLSLIFFASGIASTVCFILAARIANAIGLINTMVFTHLPSNIIMILIPFAPTLSLATTMYVVRGFLSTMDIAPRQSYIAAIVKPEERVAAASFTNVSSNVSQAISPSFAGYFLQFVATLSFPFIIGGALKSAYDVILFFSFRALKTPEEIQKKI
jgi:MFS family permease